VVTNLTGTASININGTVGATTQATGAFTTLSNIGLFTNFTNASKTASFNVNFRLLQTNEAVNYAALQGGFTGAVAAANRVFTLQTVDQGLANDGILSLQPDGGNVLVGGTAVRGTTAGTALLSLFNGTAPAGTLTNGVSLYSSSGDLKFMDAAGNAYSVGYRNIPQSGSAKTTSYTLATTDVGEYIQVSTSGSIVIPDATFSTGDAVVIFNDTSGSITITCSITTAYIGGQDSDRATVTLLTRGVCNVLFISGTVCVITGNVTA
jgi:hypothetical protein